MSAAKQWMEVRPGGPGDPDATRAAGQLTAYFALDRARDSRRLLCRLAAFAAVAASVLAAGNIVSGLEFAATLTGLGALALTAIVVEWRAERHLGVLARLR